jgi:LacI family repressor for deo operon, udp, cdd, tsx, nupC, and nupG
VPGSRAEAEGGKNRSRLALDAAGNVTSQTDARGVVTDFTDDAVNRPLTRSYPASPAENVSYAYDATTLDNQGAAAVATRHLIQLGHRRIAHIAGPADNVLTTERLTGFRRALAEADLSADEKLIVTGDFSAASGSSAVEHMLALGAAPSAIFCANDEMAMGAAVALKANGYVVPSDVSLVGFDDINLAKYYDPPLTTIHQPRRRIGESGMRLLLDLLAGEEIPVEEMNLPTELIVRGSTAPVAG